MSKIIYLLIFFFAFYITLNLLADQKFEDAIYMSYEECDTSVTKTSSGEVYSPRNVVVEQKCIEELKSERYKNISFPLIGSFLVAIFVSLFSKFIFLYIVAGTPLPPKRQNDESDSILP